MKTAVLILLSMVIVPLVLRFLYGVFLQGLEAKLKGWLSRKRPEWRRKKYVRAFVGALRGRAELMDVAVRAGVAVFVVTAVAAGMLGTGVWVLHTTKATEGIVTSTAASLDEGDAQIDAAEARNKSLTEMTKEAKPGVARENAPVPAEVGELKELTVDIKAQRQKLADLRAKFEKAKEGTSAKLAFSNAFAIYSLGLGALYGLFVLYLTFAWAPTMLATRVFSFQVSRFLLRIQGIATPEEVAALSRAEIAVHDETTLKNFVGLAVGTARAHDAESIALHFDLWDAFGAPKTALAPSGSEQG